LLMLTLLPRVRRWKVSSRLPEREAESVDIGDETRPAQTKETDVLSVESSRGAIPGCQPVRQARRCGGARS
jgi:hypothetical protein